MPFKNLRRPLLLVAALMAVSCATPSYATKRAELIPPTVLATQTGMASWYGPGFDGRTTASGEIFDQDALSAAHRTWPMGSLVQVTNLENGRSVVVRVNDRGPYARGRLIDLSRAAARVLGFEQAGETRVSLDNLGLAPLES